MEDAIPMPVYNPMDFPLNRAGTSSAMKSEEIFIPNTPPMKEKQM